VSQPACGRCGTLFMDDHLYCGECGSPRADVEAQPEREASTAAKAPAAVRAATPVPAPRAPGAWPGGQDDAEGRFPAAHDATQSGEAFFSHEIAPPPAAGVMSNSTRYLCAAAYLSPQFANRVIDHLVASHRAVAPSRGIDIEPIVRHCLKARRMQLTRDILLSLLLLAGLVLVTLPLIALLVVAFFLGFSRGANWGRLSVEKRRVAWMAGAAVIGLIVAVLVVVYIVSALASPSPYGSGPALPLPSLFPVPLLVILGLAYFALVGGTLSRYVYVRDLTLVEWLSPGAASPPFDPQSKLVESRISEVSRAQRGNLTLYDLEDPFIGTGITPFNVRRDDERVWSIAMELNRRGAKRLLPGAAPRGEVHVDPVELHSALRRRLLERSASRQPGPRAGQARAGRPRDCDGLRGPGARASAPVDRPRYSGAALTSTILRDGV
jgi:hypothetical protein